MNVVIKIPKEDYEKMRGYLSYTNYTEYGQKLLSYLQENGTPLPEHHGRLIDADELRKNSFYVKKEELISVISVNDLIIAPTIIEGSEGE